MIILRIFLYLICISSIGWSVLVFGGPPIIKRLISGYSDGTLMPSGVTVSPGLSVSISRLDFIFQNAQGGQQIDGFARAMEIDWSLLGDKPFLEINLGPSVLKDHATADGVYIYTPSFKTIDWQNISLASNIDNLALIPYAKIPFLSLAGNLSLEAGLLSNVNIVAKKVNVTDGGATYSANLIKSRISELKFKTQLNKQLFSSTFVLEDIMASKPDFAAPEAIVEINFTEESRNVRLNVHEAKTSETGGLIKNFKVNGSWNKLNDLQQLQIDFTDGAFFDNLPKFSEVSAGIKRLGNKQYQANIEGDLDEFELFDSDNFIGLLPGGNFLIDLKIDTALSKVSSISNINFNTLSLADIVGSVELGFSSEPLIKLECALQDCDLSNFDLVYLINFDDEWVKGSANCAKRFCGIAEMDHLVRTSNTANITKILNQTKILNPLSSVYFYGLISSGRNINGGHELKFQF